MTLDGGTLQFGQSFEMNRMVMLTVNDSAIDTMANTNTVNGVISGAGKLIKRGSGTLVLGKQTAIVELR